VVQLVELGLIEDFADLFTLTRDQILSLERMGERSTDTLLVALLGRLTGERGVDVPNPVVV
jgi:DNA ligase (NAD+)